MNNIENEIQSWIAVRSFAVEDASPQAPIIDANEIAEFVADVFKKLKGCVVVQKDQIETWWQDAEEPENFATQLNGLHFIADHIEDGDIMEINEHHTVHLQSSTKFGAWVCQSGQRKFIVGTKDDVEAAVKENMAMLEAQKFFEEAARAGNE